VKVKVKVMVTRKKAAEFYGVGAGGAAVFTAFT
jgi:hypothetical protein